MKCRKSILFVFMVFVFTLTMAGFVSAGEDVKNHPSCKYCAMDRGHLAHSRVYIEYDDGATEGMCSIRCAVIDLAVNIGKTPKTIQVGDYNTKRLIDAQKAFWVIGGGKAGMMTKRAKWAFEKKEDAEGFIKENGGKLAIFDEALKAAYEDMYEDTKMIREKRKKMKMMEMMEHKH